MGDNHHEDVPEDNRLDVILHAMRAMAESLEKLDKRLDRLENRLERLDNVHVAQLQTGYQMSHAAEIYGVSVGQFRRLVDKGWIRATPVEPGSSKRVVTLAAILEARERILQDEYESRLHPWHQRRAIVPPGLQQFAEQQQRYQDKVAAVDDLKREFKAARSEQKNAERDRYVAEAREFMRQMRERRKRKG